MLLKWNCKKERNIYSFPCFNLNLVFVSFVFVRIPCRSGLCTTPIQVTSSQLIANEIFPTPVVKALLYPGAVARSLAANKALPNWSSLLDTYNLTEAKNASPVVDLQRLEVHSTAQIVDDTSLHLISLKLIAELS